MCFILHINVYISIHSPRAGRDSGMGLFCESIHLFQSTLPVRGETRLGSVLPPRRQNFNPLSPCGERHDNSRVSSEIRVISIHSPRAGRDLNRSPKKHYIAISIHSPRAGRDMVDAFLKSVIEISIHSPRAGRDKIILQPILDTHQFQSTLPVRGETGWLGARMSG